MEIARHLLAYSYNCQLCLAQHLSVINGDSSALSTCQQLPRESAQRLSAISDIAVV